MKIPKSNAEDCLVLDTRDRALLAILDFDGRATLTALGKATRLSKQAVDYRMRRLQDADILQGFYAVIDIAKLGYATHRFTLKLRNFTKAKEAEFFAWCKRLPNIGWIFSVNGRWDAALSLYAKEPAELYDTLQRLRASFGEHIISLEVSTVISIHNYPHKLFGAKPSTITTGGTLGTAQLDLLDRRILSALSTDARASLVELSGRLGQNPRTLSTRIKRLEQDGIIKQYRAKINTARLGYDHHKVFLSVQQPTTISALVAWLEQRPETIFATEAIGLADLEFEAKTRSAEALYQLITQVREAFPGITAWDSVIVREERMINYFPFAELNSEAVKSRKTRGVANSPST